MAVAVMYALALLFFLLSAAAVFALRNSYSHQHQKKKLKKESVLPSPPSLPLIGHLHLIGKLPHLSMMELAKTYGGLMFLKLGSLNTLIVSSPDAARQVLKTEDPAFAWKPEHLEAKYLGYNGAGVIFAAYGEHWRQVRKLCTLELLSAKRVDLARPNRKAEMRELLAQVWRNAERGVITDLTKKLSDFTFNVMIKMVSGGDGQAQAAGLKDGIIEIVRAGTGMHIATFFPWLKWFDKQVYKMRSVHKRVDKILQRQVDLHRANFKPGQMSNDFIDVMLSGGGFRDDNIKALAADMVAASTDTGSITAEWAISEVMRHPEIAKKAREELDEVIGKERSMEESDIPRLKYLQALVKETLRLHPPVPIYPRENSREECQVGEYRVPGRTRVFVNAYAIGRDSSVWSKPEEFEPERFLVEGCADVKGQDFELIPFGAGRRMCPGMQLGMTNVMVMVGSLLHAFDWTSANSVDMEEYFGLTLARAIPLQLLPAARLHPAAYSVADS